MTRVMQYLLNTKELTLMVKPSKHPRWWVVRLYAIHLDMRSHSRIYMTSGKAKSEHEEFYTGRTSGNRQLNGPGTVDQAFFWQRKVISCLQPPYTKTKRVQSYWLSSSRRMRHLDIRYFFVMDKIQKGEVKVAFCPRHEMIGNIFTSHCKELFLHECMQRS